jgi:uncharacterized protein YndB with AHSA1/START domain
MLTASSPAKDYVEAKDAVRGVAYACRGCKAAVILHAGKVRPWHFQHHPDARCAFGGKMSQAHLDVQRTLAAVFRARGAHVELESWLPGLAGDRRIDVLVHPEGRADRSVAIEAQQADITLEAIQARSRCYRDKGVAPLWLRLIDFASLKSAQQIAGTGEIWVEKYPARSWEPWAHDEAAALWFCDTGTGLIWRGRFTKAYGYREGSEWYGPGGDFNSNPGGYYELARYVGLVLAGPYPADRLRLNRGSSRVRRRAITAWFVEPEDATATSEAVRQQLRTELHNTFYWEVCNLEHKLDQNWRIAELVPPKPSWRGQFGI